jgi:hypothetical protein
MCPGEQTAVYRAQKEEKGKEKTTRFPFSCNITALVSVSSALAQTDYGIIIAIETLLQHTHRV